MTDFERSALVDLVTRAQSGDGTAMGRLLEQSLPSILYQCRSLVRDETLAEDLAQDVEITIFEKLNTLQEPAAYWKWVGRIVTNRCKNYLIRTKVEHQIPQDDEGNSMLDNLEDTDTQTIPDQAVDNEATRQMIADLVEALPDAQRVCTMLFYYNEMSVREIAELLEVPENTVKSRLNYARKAIRTGVLDYEKQGIKLYSLSPLPFLTYFLHQSSETLRLAPGLAEQMVERAMSAAAGGSAVAEAAAGASAAAETAAGASAAAEATAGAVAAAETAAGASAAAEAAAGVSAAAGAAAAVATAAGTSAGTAAAAAGGLSAKIVALLLAGTLALGGAGSALVTHGVMQNKMDETVAQLQNEADEAVEEAQAEADSALEEAEDAMAQVDAQIQEGVAAGIEAAKPHSIDDALSLLDEYLAAQTQQENRDWIDRLIEKAMTLSGEGNTTWALRLVDNGLKYYPDDTALLDARQQIENSKVVWLFTRWEYYNLTLRQETVTTLDGVTHDSGNTFTISLNNQDANDYISVALNSNYTTLTGSTAILQYINGDETLRFRIVGDGTVLYDRAYSSVDFAQLPSEDYATENIQLDVTGVDVLTIQFYGENDSTRNMMGMDVGNYTIAKIALMDFILDGRQ